jgi:hypothetical protein
MVKSKDDQDLPIVRRKGKAQVHKFALFFLDALQTVHPYLVGNYRSLEQEHALAPVSFSGQLPQELSLSLYARNGGNASPRNHAHHQVDFHWFDGYGAVAGVYFGLSESGQIVPSFVHRYLLTDVYLHDKASIGRKPVLPSITTLLGPLWKVSAIVFAIMRSTVLVLLSLLSPTPIYRLSTANTALVYHDGRGLATCESGPPLWISLPSLDTVEWYDFPGKDGSSLRGKGGMTGMVNEWTTAHVSSPALSRE